MKLVGIGASLGTISGKARVVLSPNDCETLNDGEVLVTRMTTPDYVPAFHKAAAVVTELGSMTCHAAIVAREFQIPAVVGCGSALDEIKTGDQLTVSVEVANENGNRTIEATVEIG
jgi:pyruvate,water dikinase